MKLNLATGPVIDSNIFPAYARGTIDLSQNPIAQPQFDFVATFFCEQIIKVLREREGKREGEKELN